MLCCELCHTKHDMINIFTEADEPEFFQKTTDISVQKEVGRVLFFFLFCETVC